MSKTLWQKHSYKLNVNYMIDILMREYDLSKANISVLRDYNILSEEQYQYYLTCPKLEREIAIGKLQGRNPKATEALKDGISQAKRIFMESNNIEDSDVFAIINDAIIIIGSKPILNLQVSDRLKFRLDGTFTSYMRLKNIDLYYYFNRSTNEEKITNRGLGSAASELHRDFMIEFISEILYSTQIDGVRTSVPLLQNVHHNYINRDLPVGYYREFNSQAMYRILDNICPKYSGPYYQENAIEYEKQFIDISYNESLLREINSILASIYFGRQ